MIRVRTLRKQHPVAGFFKKCIILPPLGSAGERPARLHCHHHRQLWAHKGRMFYRAPRT